jgi:hypothetical protein
MLDTIIIKKILLRLFRVVDGRLEMNGLYFLDEELLGLFKRLQSLDEE